jgi:integrase
VSKWQRSKQAHLELLERHPFTDRNSFKLTAQDLVNHVRERRAKGAGPATVGNDLVWLGVVLRAARSVRSLPVNPVVVEEARDACRALRLIGKSRRRTRRPTSDELQQLDAFFKHRDQRGDIPMRDIMWFAIHSARRQAEICRLTWRDNNERHRTGVVRDAKHPTAKDGNDRTFKYTPEAWAIVCRQQRVSEFVFPHDPRSVSAAFTRACHVLGIENLRFHDLRHEATSRLFEAGYQIHDVTQFTLHDSWNELKRYANLRPENVRALPAGRSAANRDRSQTATQPSLFDDSSPTPERRH